MENAGWMLAEAAGWDVVWLSRVQFALTIMFHYLFPPLTIGLGMVLVYLGLRFLMTGDRLFRDAQKFWTKIYALNFALGVATGIVMEFEFGTNWSVYSEFVGDVFGSALAAEGIFAFFLESGFLAVLVFGWDRVGPKMHFFATVMVALGSIFSAVWIVAANSWQQTPAGHHIVPVMRRGEPWVVDGEVMMRAEIVDFLAMVLNPSTLVRLSHTLTGAFIVGGSLVSSVGAWYLLHGRHGEFAKRSLNGGLIVMTIGAFTAAATGHLHAKITYAYQPAKMAAFEGHFQSGRGDLTLLGLPDAEQQTVHGDVSIPGGYSWLLKEDWRAEVVGLDRFAEADRPPIWIPFVSYRLMVGIGVYLMVLSVVAVVFRIRGRLYNHRPLLWLFVMTVFLALIANHGGWVACEVGRQPWIVHPPLQWTGGSPGTGDVVVGASGKVEYDETQGLRTTDAVSGAISGDQVLGSLIGFGLIYGLLFVVWLTVLNQKIQHGPDLALEQDPSEKETSVGAFLSVGAERVGHESHMMTDDESEGEGEHGPSEPESSTLPGGRVKVNRF